MAEYVERERLRELLKDHYFPTDQEYESDRAWAVGFNAGLDKALHKIHYAPAADVVSMVPELRKVVSLLQKEYEKAKHNPIVRDPLAYALFQTWKTVDGKNGR